MKLSNLSVWVGVAAGVVAAAGEFMPGTQAYPVVCSGGTGPCVGVPGYLPALVSVLGVAVALASVAGMAVTKRAYYVATGASAATTLLMLTSIGNTSGVYYWTLTILSAVSGTLSFMAARRGAVLSEQSNPMNLPVFG